jgi:ABC-type Na+ efflux pump permease subunit
LPGAAPPGYSRGIRIAWSITRSTLVRRFFLVFLLAVALPLLLVGVAVTVSYRRFSLELAASRAAQALAGC